MWYAKVYTRGRTQPVNLQGWLETHHESQPPSCDTVVLVPYKGKVVRTVYEGASRLTKLCAA